MARQSTPLPWWAWLGVGAAVVGVVTSSLRRSRHEMPEQLADPTFTVTAAPPPPRRQIIVDLAEVPALLARLGVSPLPADALAWAPGQERAFDDWNDQVYAGRETEPPTDRMLRAITTFGWTVPPDLAFRSGSAMLSARDYALTLADRTPDHETDADVKLLAAAIFMTPELHNKVIGWSWQTRNQDSRRIPRDALRSWAEELFRRVPL